MKYTHFEINPMDGNVRIFDHYKIIKKIKLERLVLDGLRQIYGLEKED